MLSLGLLLMALEVYSILRFVGKDLGAVEAELKKDQQSAPATEVANHILGCINSTVASRIKENINSLSLALMRFCWEQCVQFWTRYS